MYDSSRLWNFGASAPVRRATAPPSRRHTSARGWFYRTFIADRQWLLPQPPWPPECWSSAVGTATKTSATTPPTSRPVATTAPTISCCGRFDASVVSRVVGWWVRLGKFAPQGSEVRAQSWIVGWGFRLAKTGGWGREVRATASPLTEWPNPFLPFWQSQALLVMPCYRASQQQQHRRRSELITCRRLKCASTPLPHGQIRKKCLTTSHYDQEGMKCSTHLFRTYPGLCSWKAKSVCYCNVSAILAQQHERSGWWLRQFLSWFDHSVTLSCLKPPDHSFCHDFDHSSHSRVRSHHIIVSVMIGWQFTLSYLKQPDHRQVPSKTHDKAPRDCLQCADAERSLLPDVSTRSLLAKRENWCALWVFFGILFCQAVRKTRSLPFLDTFLLRRAAQEPHFHNYSRWWCN